MFPDSRTRKELFPDSTSGTTEIIWILPRLNNNSKRKVNGNPNRQNPLFIIIRHQHNRIRINSLDYK